MRALRKWLHSHLRLYLVYRQARARLVKWRYGFRGVHPTSLIVKPAMVSRDLQTGAYCSISHGAWIAPKVRLGNYVLLGPEVAIVGGDHVFDVVGTPITFTGRPKMPETVIEDDAWVGQRALIKAGVRIGRGSIVAMGSVVTKSVEPYVVVGGVPAQVLRRRFRSKEEEAAHDRMLSEPPRLGRFCGDREEATDIGRGGVESG